jgi:PAS domain S-box-containing protein
VVQRAFPKLNSRNGQAKDEWFNRNDSFTSLFETIPDALLVVNKEGKIEHANKQAESLFLYKRQELKGKGVELLVPHMVSVLPSRRRRNFFVKPKRLKIGSSHKLYGVQKRGKEFPVELVLNPFLYVGKDDGCVDTESLGGGDGHFRRE